MTATPCREGRPLRVRRGGLSLTPMIDIVFQMISFFIFALNFEPLTVSPDIKPPVWSQPVPPPVDRSPVIVEVQHDGRLVTTDGVYGLDSEEAGRFISAAVEKAGTEQEMVIRADRGVEYAELGRVMQMCRNAGRRQIGLQLVRETELTGVEGNSSTSGRIARP